MTEKLEKKGWTRKKQFLLLMVMPLYFMVVGLALQPLGEILPGLAALIREPDFLITDYFVIGGVGAAFMNAGLLTMLLLWLLYKMGVEVDGHTITSSFLMFGFSLFGKNLLNIWTIFLGAWMYARFRRESFRSYIYVALYGTSLSPIITEMLQIQVIPAWARLAVSLLVGLIIGFVLPPLSAHTKKSHMGFSLYNVGFSGGIIATVIVSVMKSFGLKIRTRLIWQEGVHPFLLIMLCLFFLAMIGAALAADKREAWSAYVRILKTSGIGAADYLQKEGMFPTMFNMGVNGLFATLLLVFTGGDLNGPTIGGILTIAGFSATGKHLRNIVPVMAGVCIAGAAKLWDITDPSSILALLFSTTLAPVAGEFGVLAGILAGFLHSSVAIHVGIVYGGMNLYNNGFAGGLTAIFLVPLLQSLRETKGSRVLRQRQK